MANCMSAFKAMMFGHLIHMFQDPRINYFQKAMVLGKLFNANLKLVNIQNLLNITKAHGYTNMGQVFEAIYSLSFFSFLQLSNLVPHSVKLNFILAPPRLSFVVKWSKAIQ